MQTNIDYRIYSIKCRAQSDEWGVYSKIIRKETHFNKDMIVAVVIVINQLEINPPPKFGTSTGFEPMTSVLALQCSTNWAMKTHTLGEDQFVEFNLTREKNETTCSSVMNTLPDSYDFVSAGKGDLEHLSVFRNIYEWYIVTARSTEIDQLRTEILKL